MVNYGRSGACLNCKKRKVKVRSSKFYFDFINLHVDRNSSAMKAVHRVANAWKSANRALDISMGGILHFGAKTSSSTQRFMATMRFPATASPAIPPYNRIHMMWLNRMPAHSSSVTILYLPMVNVPGGWTLCPFFTRKHPRTLCFDLPYTAQRMRTLPKRQDARMLQSWQCHSIGRLLVLWIKRSRTPKHQSLKPRWPL